MVKEEFLCFYDGMMAIASQKILHLFDYGRAITSSTNMLFLHFQSDDDKENDVVFYLEYLSYDAGKYFLNY